MRQPIREGCLCWFSTQKRAMLYSTPETGGDKNLMPDGMTDAPESSI